MTERAASRGNTEAAYHQIRRAIVEGRYRPGQRLVEQRVAEEFEFSRTPVREALRRLESEGLVDTEPNRGASVRGLTIGDVEDLYGLRARLEAYAASLAADRRTDGDMASIDEGIVEFEEALSAGHDDLDETRAVDRANRRIHDAVVAAARHHRLAKLLERAVDMPLVFQAFRQFGHEERRRSHLFHQLIRDAIAVGDAERASNLMYEHVLQGRDALVPYLRANGAGVDGLFGD